MADNHADLEYVDGYLVGSEGYIPAAEYTQRRDQHVTWQYSFQRQWLFYLVWGRLLYNPELPDSVFEDAFDRRYRPGVGQLLLEGYRLGSRMIQELASFHAGTWDYTLYAEGFLAPAESVGRHDGVSPFISIDEFIDHEMLDSEYVSIPAYVAGDDDGITPLELAERVAENGSRVCAIADELRSHTQRGDGALIAEIQNVEAWGYLNQYLGAKLRGGVALERFRQEGRRPDQERAVGHLRAAREHWNAVCGATRMYREVPYATDWHRGGTFAWSNYRDQVDRDIDIALNASPRE